MTKPYSIDIWGSDPDEDNDDCWTGVDFDTLESAQEVFEAMKRGDWAYGGHFRRCNADAPGTAIITLTRKWVDETACICSKRPVYRSCCDHIVVEHIEKAPNPLYKPSRNDDADDEWRREMRMQAGMGFGIQGYNDYEGC